MQASSAHPLPSPLGRPSSAPATVDERKAPENNRPNTASSKLSVLRAYRRAKGLCFKCGEKWGHGHCCGPTIRLQVMEELIQALQLDEESTVLSDGNSVIEELSAISKEAIQGTESPRTIWLQGWIKNKQVLMLADSGSTHTFTSHQMAALFPQAEALEKFVRVKIADGGELQCTHQIPKFHWWVQGYVACSNMRIIPLGTYDVILGMDWLERYSPMEIHWKQKHLSFDHGNRQVTLQGVLGPSQLSLATSTQLKGLQCRNALLHMVQLQSVEAQSNKTIPPKILDLLLQLQDVFQEPKGLPPQRGCDHRIPLIPGARPIHIRPYRYSLKLKDEIEKQIKELLQNGRIQTSSSPFSSPVVLVRKKDGGWRMCVDYRYLNAMTVIGKFPLPVIDELLDELQGACWFTRLDLHAGLHQIRLAEGEGYKTTF
ncbi:hypothetical protein PR202_gb07177 [Eleusine coracana subsp. coracana]|uniref:Reverse transcriptase domain-containing protein n=1 Tax=Eleusine coracana subsp. coracana TaxID=191504 RepID=A0AAV5EAU5_ELECO|nr:hypothetical protein PR202_gb07177 [Eleusine coracana subsp. coracana]